MPTRVKLTEPHLSKRPKQKMAVVIAHGDPNEALPKVLPALYGTVYRLKFGLKKAGKPTFKVGALLARWPIDLDAPRDQWVGQVGLPIPASTRQLLSADAEVPVGIETWEYGPAVAEILHVGPYSQERGSVDRLLQFIGASGYEVAGAHEEEYLTSPKAKIQKTIVRFPVRKTKAR